MTPMMILLCTAIVAGTAVSQSLADDSRLKVSDNRRYLVHADGKPFFYLGDTAWELFHRLNREQATRYLEDRAKKGFTVIQAVAIAELDGHTDPNPYGHLPFVDRDPARPAVKDGPNNDYWDHVDFIVDKANSLGLWVGFLPTWGRYWHDTKDNQRPIFNRENADAYGEWLGKRYRDKKLIWILGGDRAIDSDDQKEIIRAMASGLHKGDGGAHLTTFHPPGGNGSSTWFHNDDWLDFNMRQNGHVVEFTGRYAADAHRLRPHADQAGHRRRADLRGPPGLVQSERTGPLDRRRHPATAVLGPVHRRLRLHLRTPLGLADVVAQEEPDQQSADALVGSHQPAGSGPDAVRTRLLESRPILSRVPDQDS